MQKKIFIILSAVCLSSILSAQIPQPVKRLLNHPCLAGSTFSLSVKELPEGRTVYSYNADRQMTPASVMKTVTTATALALLGADFRYPTTLAYDGRIENGVLKGNLYIEGSGDPTLGSAHFAPDRTRYTPDQNTFIPTWISAIRKAGIQKIEGQVIADESIFDTEGISPKWVHEDIGSYYGAGSYGLNVFDNLYTLHLATANTGTSPRLLRTEPALPTLRFHNYLQIRPVATDSSFILGMPFVWERYLYGTVPAHRADYLLKGDIPDPSLFLATYLTERLKNHGIAVQKAPSCYRLLQEKDSWKPGKRIEIITTYSPPLKEIIRVTNHVSHNLFADALLKTIGLRYQPRKDETLSSFQRGIRQVENYWKEKGLDTSSLWMYDGSGLAVTCKVSAAFITDLFIYLAKQPETAAVFMPSLPRAGRDGSVRNFLKGTVLENNARLKSGSMSRVKGYAGYLTTGDKQYAIALFVNDYASEGKKVTRVIEDFLLQLFP